MSTNTPVPTVPKVRTFAADLSEARTERGLATPTPKQPVVTKVPTPKQNAAPTSPSPVTERARPAAKVATPVPPPTVVPKTVADAAIPPFHTLNKTSTPVQSIDTSAFVAANKKIKPSVLAGPGEEPLAVNSRDTSGDGTIITDTKRKRFSLLEAIQESLAGWFQKRKQAALRRKVPTYTVPEADRRKGVIQKATTQTGRASTADHQAALGRIKSSQKTARRTSATTAPVINHTSLIEPFAEAVNEDSVPAPEIASQPPETVARPLITPVIPDLPMVEVEPEPVIPSADTGTTTIKSIAEKLHELEQRTALTEAPAVPEPVTALQTESTPVVTPLTRPRITPTIPSLAPDTAVEPILADTSEEPVLAVEEPEPTPRPNWSQALPQPTTAANTFAQNAELLQGLFRRTNHVALGVAGGIGVVVIGWYGIQAIRTLRVTPTTTPDSYQGSFLTTSVTIATSTSISTKENFIRTLHAIDSSNDSLTEIMITNSATGALLSPTELFKILDARVNTNFIAAVDRVGFGNYRGTPWLILHASDGPGVQGGMLAWENILDADLSLWYSTSTLRATKKGITLFHDDTIAGHDVRVLSDGEGKERIVYGFITPHQLLITNNTTTFLNLADKGTSE